MKSHDNRGENRQVNNGRQFRRTHLLTLYSWFDFSRAYTRLNFVNAKRVRPHLDGATPISLLLI